RWPEIRRQNDLTAHLAVRVKRRVERDVPEPGRHIVEVCRREGHVAAVGYEAAVGEVMDHLAVAARWATTDVGAEHKGAGESFDIDRVVGKKAVGAEKEAHEAPAAAVDRRHDLGAMHVDLHHISGRRRLCGPLLGKYQR